MLRSVFIAGIACAVVACGPSVAVGTPATSVASQAAGIVGTPSPAASPVASILQATPQPSAMPTPAALATPQEATPPPSPAPTPTAALKLVALGDSIAAFADAGGDAYPQLFTELVHQATGRVVDAVSYADPSATSSSLLAALSSDASTRAAVAAADIITITVGGNDADPTATYPAGTCASAQTESGCLKAYAPALESNLDGILSAIETLVGGRKIAIRLTSPDYNPFIGWSEAPTPSFGVDFYRQVAAAETSAACRVAVAHGARCADFFHAFHGPDGAADAGQLLAADHVHPSAAGRELIATTIFELGLAELGGIPSASPSASGSLSLVGLGDSVAGAGHCGRGCRSYVVVYGELASASLGMPVAVTNLGRNDDFTSERMLQAVSSDASVRDALAKADIVTLDIGWNDWQGPCFWDGLAECLQTNQDAAEQNIDKTLGEINALRGGAPTAIRLPGHPDPYIGHFTAEDWQLPAGVQVEQADALFLVGLRNFNAMLCRVASAHGGMCVDTLAAFNGPTGDQPIPTNLLESQAQMDLIARELDAAGYAPLRGSKATSEL
jgi:lysophospholipase L1-like esterase